MNTGVRVVLVGNAVAGKSRGETQWGHNDHGRVCCGASAGGQERGAAVMPKRKVRMLIAFVRRDDEGRQVSTKPGATSAGTCSCVATAASRGR